MNKDEFVRYMAKKYDCQQKKVHEIIKMFTESVVGAIIEDNEVSLAGFGSFYVSKVDARTGRNPATGKAVDIPARNHPKFKAGSKFKVAVNKQ